MTDATEIYVPGLAYLFLGPVGTTAPVDASETPDDPMYQVGFFADDSLKFSTDPNFNEITSHQATYPTRTVETDSSATFEVDLQQWSAVNFQAVYGGGTVTAITPASDPPNYKFSPPVVGGRQEKMAICQLIDGDKHYMLIMPRVMQKAGVNHEMGKSDSSVLPLRLSILSGGVGDPFYWISDDPAFNPA